MQNKYLPEFVGGLNSTLCKGQLLLCLACKSGPTITTVLLGFHFDKGFEGDVPPASLPGLEALAQLHMYPTGKHSWGYLLRAEYVAIPFRIHVGTLTASKRQIIKGVTCTTSCRVVLTSTLSNKVRGHGTGSRQTLF